MGVGFNFFEMLIVFIINGKIRVYFWWGGWSFVYERRGCGWLNGRISGNSKVVELSTIHMVTLREIGGWSGED